jgi:hypothetical protein
MAQKTALITGITGQEAHHRAHQLAAAGADGRVHRRRRHPTSGETQGTVGVLP